MFGTGDRKKKKVNEKTENKVSTSFRFRSNIQF